MLNQYQSEHFDKNLTQWWDTKGEFSLLHKINPLRSNYILNLILKYFYLKQPSKIKILDIGCGGGLVSSFFDQKGFNVTGLDPNAKTLNAAIKYRDQNKLKAQYINKDLENFIKDNKQHFDVVLCLEILEHIDNVDSFLSLLPKVVNQKGIVILSTINKNFESYIKIILLCEYLLGLIPHRTHQYSKFLKPSQINKILSKFNMKLLCLDGLNFSLTSRNFYISKCIKTNYFLTYYKSK